jgi:hypothetical protein
MLLWVYIHTGPAWKICPATVVWMYTQSNITHIIFTWVHNTNTEKNNIIITYLLRPRETVCNKTHCFLQHELHLWIYYMSKFLNTPEFIIMINSRQILNLS